MVLWICVWVCVLVLCGEIRIRTLNAQSTKAWRLNWKNNTTKQIFYGSICVNCPCFPFVNNFGEKKERKNLPVEKEEDLSKWFIVSQIRKPSRILNPTDLLTFAMASTSKSDSASEESICQSGDNSKQRWFDDDQMMIRLCELREF